MQWYERDKKRLKIEITAVKDRYPQFELIKLRDGRLAWRGWLRTRRAADTYGRRYGVLVVYPSNYPVDAPRVYVEGISGIESTPHMFSDGSLCLFYPNDPRQWNPQQSTAVVAISWTAAWLHAYEVWKRTGRWPGRSLD